MDIIDEILGKFVNLKSGPDDTPISSKSADFVSSLLKDSSKLSGNTKTFNNRDRKAFPFTKAGFTYDDSQIKYANGGRIY